MRMLYRAVLVSTIVAVAIAIGVAAPRHTAAAKVLEPLVPGWERIFKLDWELEEKRGRPVVNGYVVNDSPYELAGVRLLVEGLDEQGNIASQRLTWVPGDLTPFSRRYFEAPAPGRHPKYQVRVFAYDRVERGDGRRKW